MSDTPPLAAPAPAAGYSYDEVPYESHPYAQTHPSRLATVATLFGLKPPRVERCRVLELGCAAGGNIVPVAESFRDSDFVGIDLSGRQIADGERVVLAAGLPNVKLRHASILDVNESYGPFDYIICHGVFSWVPDVVREKILDICAKHLTTDGVAYISYNTYPGWHMRGMIRDMMRFHALRFDAADTRVKQARALLDFLAQSAPGDGGGAYSSLLRTELETLRHQADHYLYHEHLEDVNDPLYFHQFATLAMRHGLRYLGEARITTMVSANFTPEVQKTLKVVANDQIQAEQYMDFVRNRTFRETLLVKADAVPNWSIEPEAIRKLHLTTTRQLPVNAGDVHSTDVVQYQSQSGLVISTSSQELKASMRILAQRWPATVSFPELKRGVSNLLGLKNYEGNSLELGLLNAYLGSDLLDLHAAPITPAVVGEKPVALATARAQMLAGQVTAANRRHDVYRAGEFERKLIPLLDGTRDRTAIVEELTRMVVAQELTVQRDGQPVTDPAALREILWPVLDRSLADLAASAMLK